MRPRALAFSLFAALAGCATSPAQRPDEPLIAGPADEQAPDPARGRRRVEAPPPVTAAPVAAPIPTGAAGSIPRAELDRVLAGSPGAFLARVDADPVLEGRRFVGWRIRSLFAGDARFAGCALRPGDVVTRVNGLPIERPEQFAAAWDALRGASALSVDVLRDGRPGTLTFPITAPAAR